jgi:hypothetical protein
MLVLQYFTLSGLSTDLGLLNNGKYFSALFICDGLICNTLIRYYHLGVHHRYHIFRFYGQIWRLCARGIYRRFQLERVSSLMSCKGYIDIIFSCHLH